MAGEEKELVSVPMIRAELFSGDPGFLVRAGKHIHDRERDALGRHPLTSPQFAILLAASRVPGSDQAMISYLSALDTSTTSEVIRRLSKQRQVVVQRDPDDGRRSRVFVSESATAQVESYLEKLASADNRIFSWLRRQDRKPFLTALRTLAYHEQDEEASASMARVPVTRVRWAVSETNYAFGRLVRIIAQRYNEMWKDSKTGLTPVQHEFLCLLQGRPGISQNLAGEVLYLDRATTAGLVSRLGGQALISSRISEEDRRRKDLALTPAGTALLHKVTVSRSTVNHRFLSLIGTENQDVLLRGLNRIVIAAEEDSARDY